MLSGKNLNRNETYKVKKSLPLPACSHFPHPNPFLRNILYLYPPASLSVHVQTHHPHTYTCMLCWHMILFYFCFILKSTAIKLAYFRRLLRLGLPSQRGSVSVITLLGEAGGHMMSSLKEMVALGRNTGPETSSRWGTEVCQRPHSELGSGPFNPSWIFEITALADTLTAALWDALGQRHPARFLLDSWLMKTMK